MDRSAGNPVQQVSVADLFAASRVGAGLQSRTQPQQLACGVPQIQDIERRRETRLEPLWKYASALDVDLTHFIG